MTTFASMNIQEINEDLNKDEAFVDEDEKYWKKI
jgi:hypothetical protein